MTKKTPVALCALVLTGCAPSPAISKSTMGNCQVEVIAPPGFDVRRAELYVDDVFVGNATENLPVLQLRRGEHTIRAELPGCEAVEATIAILGEPNHQVINIFFEEVGSDDVVTEQREKDAP